MDLLMRRRALMDSTDNSWPSIGEWLDNKTLDRTGVLVDDESRIVTPYFKVTPTHKIKFSCVAFNTVGLLEYNLDFNKTDFWNQTGNSRTITLTSNSYYIRANIEKFMIDNSYIKDVTTGEYIYKGKNVQ